MQYEEKWTPLLKEFESYYPDLVNNIAFWYPCGQTRIIFKLKDYSKIEYNSLTHQIRTIYSIQDNHIDMDESEVKTKFAQQLKDRMNICGYGTEYLSEQSGISRMTIYKYINKKALPSIYNLRRLAKALHCSDADLLDF